MPVCKRRFFGSAFDRADICSLGCTLFFLLAGKVPTEAASDATQPGRAASGRRQPLPDIFSRRRDCPRQLELLSTEQEAGRTIIVFWDDGKCWVRTEDALGENDWPFDSQLGHDGSIR